MELVDLFGGRLKIKIREDEGKKFFEILHKENIIEWGGKLEAREFLQLAEELVKELDAGDWRVHE